jgi:ABC-type glutathione transport system ATPase component
LIFKSFEFKIALRFLVKGKFQTIFIIFGISIGVAVQFFLSSLINGLQKSLIERTVGSSAHISILPEDIIPKSFLSTSDILKIKDKYPSQISGGQQQRTSIARALVKNPKVIFADEPTGNLDKETGNVVLDIMLEMIREFGTTLVMVTHDREVALRAERVIELVDGKICKSFLIKEEGLERAKKILEDRTCTLGE